VRRFFATVARTRSPKRGNEDRLGGQIFLAEGYRIKDRDGGNTIRIGSVREAILPAHDRRELGPCRSVRSEDRTKPPARYKRGVPHPGDGAGRPRDEVTRHEIIKKLYDRKFIEGKYPNPTTSGPAVIEASRISARITEPE